MNLALWIVAGLLAAAFLAAGVMKATQPREKLAHNMGWVDDFDAGTVTTIGILEILAAIGLVLPAIVDVAPVLVPVAATGIVIIMLGAIRTHLRRNESQMVPVNVILLLLAAFVAWGRFGPHAF